MFNLLYYGITTTYVTFLFHVFSVLTASCIFERYARIGISNKGESDFELIAACSYFSMLLGPNKQCFTPFGPVML